MRLNPDLPAELERIIDKCLEKDRNLRYQHASEMRADLQRLKRDTESGKSAAQETGITATKAGRSTWIVVAAVLLVTLLAAVGYFFSHRRKGKLTDKDTIILADFDNHTGDSLLMTL